MVYKINQRLIHGLLQHLLLLFIQGSVYPVSPGHQQIVALLVHLGVLLIISRPVRITGKLIFKVKALELHQFLHRTVGRKGLHIVADVLCLRVRQHNVLRLGILAGGGINDAVLLHLIQNPVPPFQRLGKIRPRIIPPRAVGDRTERGDLGQIQLGHTFAEIPPAGRLDTVIAVGIVNIVDVIFQNLLLGILLFQLHGNEDLFHLPLPAHRMRQENIPAQLLGDGAATLGDGLLTHQRYHRPENGLHVKALMLVKPLVLDADKRLLHIVRDLLGFQVVDILVPFQRLHHISAVVVHQRRLG